MPKSLQVKDSGENGWCPLLGLQDLESGVLETWRMAVLSEAKFSRCFGKSEVQRVPALPALTLRPALGHRKWLAAQESRRALRGPVYSGKELSAFVFPSSRAMQEAPSAAATDLYRNSSSHASCPHRPLLPAAKIWTGNERWLSLPVQIATGGHMCT